MAVAADRAHSGSTPQQIPVSVVATTTNVIEPIAEGRTVPGPAASNVGPNSPTVQLNKAQEKLMGILPPGYGADSCQPVAKPVPNAVATIDCWDNSLPGGPTVARYSLFSDAKSLAASFKNGLKDLTVTPCPNGGASPGPWVYGDDTEIAGEKMCGTDPDNNDNAAVGWTETARLLQAVAEGPNLADLYGWWAQPGGPNTVRNSGT